MGGDEERAVEAAYAALAEQDEAGLRLLLHPYLRYTGPNGLTLRGRTKVLALLQNEPDPPRAPIAVELRDGQIYRWQVG